MNAPEFFSSAQATVSRGRVRHSGKIEIFDLGLIAFVSTKMDKIQFFADCFGLCAADDVVHCSHVL